MPVAKIRVAIPNRLPYKPEQFIRFQINAITLHPQGHAKDRGQLPEQDPLNNKKAPETKQGQQVRNRLTNTIQKVPVTDPTPDERWASLMH